MSMRRRTAASWRWLAAMAVALLGGCAAKRAAPSASLARDPGPLNVVVLMADDHSADVFGAYGSRLARTPNLDALAARGVRFDRAYANQPICTPSRQSLLTGLYPHAVGVTLLETALDDASTTSMAEHFVAHGHRAGVFGKMHWQSNAKHGFQRVVDKKEHAQHLKAHPPADLPPGVRVRGPWRPFKDPARVWLNADALPGPYRTEDSDAAFYVRSALDFIDEGQGRPFFVFLSFYEPHSPFPFPIEYAGRVDPKTMPVPTVSALDALDAPIVFESLSDDDKRGIAAAYHTSVGFMDDMAGRFLRGLADRGLGDRTLIVYLSDHGYHLGHHGRFEKHSFYERAVRTPLVFAGPGLPQGRVSKGLVELVDLFPTLTDLAGLPTPPRAQGRSVRALVEGRSDVGRPEVLSTYTHAEEGMIRTERWKLVHSVGQRPRDDGYVSRNPTPGRTIRLFDVNADPEERLDVANEPGNAAVVAELERRLHERLRTTWPADLPAPADASIAERIDWMLQAPERLRATSP